MSSNVPRGLKTHMVLEKANTHGSPWHACLLLIPRWIECLPRSHHPPPASVLFAALVASGAMVISFRVEKSPDNPPTHQPILTIQTSRNSISLLLVIYFVRRTVMRATEPLCATLHDRLCYNVTTYMITFAPLKLGVRLVMGRQSMDCGILEYCLKSFTLYSLVARLLERILISRRTAMDSRSSHPWEKVE
ncbi:hypothetical protein J3458_019969 [Metarhizium acridum]|uniref:uncharacterized protein n=1 Tax=Metarhizium acridum TaxID=92637 RepID=UPI001C6C870C|nr:hypothetical protein J3458_019969 [Metarhizium acridum]